jgi:hypothetical protein
MIDRMIQRKWMERGNLLEGMLESPLKMKPSRKSQGQQINRNVIHDNGDLCKVRNMLVETQDLSGTILIDN